MHAGGEPMPRRRASAARTEKARSYRELLAEQRDSALTLRAFARKKGLPETTLAWWKYTIAERDRTRSKTNGAKTNGTSISLVPIKVVGGPVPTTTFVVQLRSGHSVRVERGFDAEELRRLVTALDGSC